MAGKRSVVGGTATVAAEVSAGCGQCYGEAVDNTCCESCAGRGRVVSASAHACFDAVHCGVCSAAEQLSRC